MLALLIRSNKEMDRFLPLDGGKEKYSLGRGQDVDIKLNDNQISRHHLDLFRRDEAWYLLDNASRNGTKVNNQRIENEVPLKNIDSFALGGISIYVFEIEEGLQPEMGLDLSANTTMAHTSEDNHLIASSSPKMMKVMEQVLKVSRFDITVHITGETGSGKEVVAKAISGISPRRDGKFVKINCGAISEDLIDSELFGHLKGSFTGAEADRKGLFEEANGGTLFLDEVGELSNAAQIKLLRAIETKTIRPVGGREDVHVDIRVISATHCSLSERVKEGRFREDLYYRLNVFTIEVPPLRQRKGDIESIATILLKDAHLSPEALTLLKNHDWPGNIRQLKNILEAASIVAKEGRIQAGDIHLFDEEDEETSAFQTLEDLGAEKARDHILKAIEVANGNKTKAAKILGISRASLYEKIKAYNIQ